MGMSGDTALALAKSYVKKTLEGQGALKGQDGFSPTVKENPSNTDNDYRLDITDKNGTITTPNLKGTDGSGSDYKQLKNKPSINGVELDGNKNLDDLGIQQKGEYLTEETDPTVPQWAKENTKPTYTASEVGAYTKTETDTKLNGKANSSHTHGNGDITSLDAGKITSGTISIDRLPQGALDRLIKVVDDAARFKLTTKDVQLGDSVKVTSTKKMYIVVDETKLSSEDGYEPYTADSATSVPWSGVTGKPSTYTPSSHTHTKSQITDFPSSLPANGGNASTVNGHTVKSDVPENAVFTDTVYDDTKIKKRVSDNGYGEVAGGKNLLNHNIIDSKMRNCSVLFKNDTFYVTNKGSFSNFVLSVPTIVGKSYTVTIKDWSDYSYRCITSVSDLSDNTLVSMAITDATLSMTFTAVGTESLINISPNNTPNEMSNTITFKCMLEEGSVATEYEPYFPSNKMLAEETSDISEDIDTLKKETTVNLLNPTLQTTTKNGVTFTNNGDGTYTLNGTASAYTSFTFDTLNLTNGKYKLLGATAFRRDINGNWNYTFHDGDIIEIDDTYPVLEIVYTISEEGTSLDNKVVKPMITTNLNATYDDFVPYTGSTGQLNSDVASIKNDLGGLSFSVSDGALSITDGTNTWTLPQTT